MLKRERVKFDVGTIVNRSGYRGVVVEIRNESQREVSLERGIVVVDIADLKYWRKGSKEKM